MDIRDYISSGILEQYVLGNTGKEESMEVERMAAAHLEIRNEIAEISRTIEQLAMANAVTPSRNVKPFLMATIDFMERMEQGEKPSLAPLLNEDSKLNDYSSWLNRNDIVLPLHATDPYAKIISSAPGVVTAIVWIKNESPLEIHHDEYEKFLIVEGSCDIIVEKEIQWACVFTKKTTEGSISCIEIREYLFLNLLTYPDKCTFLEDLGTKVFKVELNSMILFEYTFFFNLILVE